MLCIQKAKKDCIVNIALYFILVVIVSEKRIIYISLGFLVNKLLQSFKQLMGNTGDLDSHEITKYHNVKFQKFMS